jgi:cell wall-associated NlpC family hydrolase
MLTLSQNLHDYLPQDCDAIIPHQKDCTIQYMSHYFSPWTEQKQIRSNAQIKRLLLDVIIHHTQYPGYALTRKRHDLAWISSLAQLAQLDSFPNLSVPGIALVDVETRLLPTVAPSFKDIYSEWDGYPFDSLQQSYLTAGTPVRVLHITSDHAWFLVLTDGFFGWVKAECIAFVSEEVMQCYQTASYTVALKDQTVFFQGLTQLPIALRIGNIYPVHSYNKTTTTIYIPGADACRNAVIYTREVPNTCLSTFPYPFTLRNIAYIGQKMMGDPYGWGGLCGYRDCSSTLADLMTTFGIWLPRNSKAQIQAGRSTYINHVTPSEKLSILSEKFNIFTTLLYFPGHIMLYLGEKEGVHAVYHSASRCYGTVITPLEMCLQGRSNTLLEALEQVRRVWT